MKNKKQDPALQAPSEANRAKHMNYLKAEEQRENAGVTRDEESEGDDKTEESSEENIPNKYDADSGNDGSTNQMLQQENLIDPGNEHNHMEGAKTKKHDDFRSKKLDADAGGDGTGTMGSKPAE